MIFHIYLIDRSIGASKWVMTVAGLAFAYAVVWKLNQSLTPDEVMSGWEYRIV